MQDARMQPRMQGCKVQQQQVRSQVPAGEIQRRRPLAMQAGGLPPPATVLLRGWLERRPRTPAPASRAASRTLHWCGPVVRSAGVRRCAGAPYGATERSRTGRPDGRGGSVSAPVSSARISLWVSHQWLASWPAVPQQAVRRSAWLVVAGRKLVAGS
eukprot:COSAG01_NODE_1080_length_11819_cov_29.816212_10_plen_157_part_00